MLRKCKGRGKAKYFGCGQKKEIEKGKFSLCNDCYKNFLLESEYGNILIQKATERAERDRKRAENRERRAEKEELRKQREDIKTLAELKKELQTLINFIVRHIDYEKGCISCEHGWESEWTRQRQAGHFYDKKNYDFLRFNLFNIFPQCSICNDRLSANLEKYRKGIIKHYNKDTMQYIESLPTKYKNVIFTIPGIKKAIETARMIKKDILNGKDYSRIEVNSLLELYK